MIPDLYAPPDSMAVAEPASGEQPRPSELRLRRKRGSLLTRLASMGLLGGVLWGFSSAGVAAYRLATDAFVAPLILSQNSDEVVQSKLSLSHLLGERDSINVRMRESEMAIQAALQAIQRLEQVRVSASKALDWSVAITAQQTDLGERDLSTLGAQQQVLQNMLAKQDLAPVDPARPPNADDVASYGFRRGLSGQLTPRPVTHRSLCRRAASRRFTSQQRRRTLGEVLLLRELFAGLQPGST